jgi:von Willebrand factor A domain-containing protein 8
LRQSGDGPDITLVPADKPPTELKERWKVAEKMYMIPQYAFAGDYTGMLFVSLRSYETLTFDVDPVDAITKGVTEVAKYDADDWFVIAITVSASSLFRNGVLT